MPFLLGTFGVSSQQTQRNRLAATAEIHAKRESLCSSAFDQGIVYAGYKHNEKLSTDIIITLPDNSGLFAGRLFDRQGYAPASFTYESTQALINDPKILLKQWWGRYIGAFHNKNKQICTLVRDPQGLSSLFYTVQQGNVIFSSDLFCLYDVLDTKPALNLAYFAEYISTKKFVSALTPFHHIYELLPGTALHINADGTFTTELLWDLTPYSGAFISNENEFEEELLTTLKSTLKAWVGTSQNISLELSGGTDSSGLMILLRSLFPEKKIIGINYIDSKTPSSNEIGYAQEVADACASPLYFVDWNNTSLLSPLPEAWRPDRPTSFLLFYNSSTQVHDLANQHGCTEFMNGQGGDHVFLAPHPTDSLADYWLDRGFGGITRPMHQLSSARRMPWWMLARDTIKKITEHYIKKEAINQDAFEFFDSAFSYKYKEDFYLREHIKHFYPAKKEHVKGIFHGSAFADLNQRTPYYTITSPLLSQPIVELGLRIPTYQSFNNGYDRIFFRNAISRVQKLNALWRTSKGETTSTVIKAYSKHALQIHDMVLQGSLVKNGLINKQWLNDEIIRIRHGKIDNLWPFIRLLASQRWLDQWKL